MRLKINRLKINKNVFIFIGTIFLHFSSNGQTLTGSNINVYGTSGASDYIIQQDGNITQGYANNASQGPNLFSSTQIGSSYTTNTFIAVDRGGGASIGSSVGISLYSGTINSADATINGTNGLAISPTASAMFSVGSGSSTAAGWLSSSAAAITSANGILADSTGTYLQSATDLVLTGTAISLTGATNINTTGSYNTSVGNTTGIVTIAGSAVNVGTNSGSSVTLGSSTGNSTVSLNGNRLQNVGAGVAGTDAVNLNQVNSLMSSTTSQITSLQNQANTNKSGISGVSAMANIPSLSASQKNNFGVGIGAFQGSSAIAFGGNFRIKDNLVGKISASLSSGNYVTGAGLSFGW